MTKKNDADILFFTGVKRSQPVARDYAALLKMAVEALEAVKRMNDEALPQLDWRESALDANAFRLLNEVPIAVQTTLEAIRKAGVK